MRRLFGDSDDEIELSRTRWRLYFAFALCALGLVVIGWLLGSP